MYNSDDSLSSSKNLSGRLTFSEGPDSSHTLTSVSDLDAAITDALMGGNSYDSRSSFSESLKGSGSDNFRLPTVTDLDVNVSTSIHDYAYLLMKTGGSSTTDRSEEASTVESDMR